MEQRSITDEHIQIQARNIGGLDEADVSFEPGVTILTGRNATHKTSLLQALMAGLGSKNVSLKSDADSGAVTLRVGEEEYHVDLSRENGHVQFEGTPYCEDPTLPDLFAFLLASNETRRTVELGGDLRDIVMEPVDTEAIQAEIRRLQSEKNDLDDEIQRRETLDDEIADLETRRAELTADLETKREDLAAKREELEAAVTDQTDGEESEREETRTALQEVRSDLEDVRFRIESQRESLVSLREEREELTEAQEDLSTDEHGDIEEIRAEISQLRSRKQQLESELNTLQNVIQFNEEMLEGENEEIASALPDEDDADAVTDQLLDADSMVCWTCGTSVPREEIEQTIDALRELRSTRYSTQQDLDEQLSELKEKQSALEQRQERREHVERKLSNVESEITRREEDIDHLEQRREELRTERDDLEEELEQLEQADSSERRDLEREVSQLEVEIDRLEDNRDRIDEQVADLETQVDELADLRERRETITGQLSELRNRVDRIEQEAISAFNEHMETVLDILEYENLDRVWMDRAERETRQGRRKATETEFRLHVVRSSSDGTTYEDAFDHLSESEREVTALVFALAGYLAHDVHEQVPFMLLDSLDALDAERTDVLVEYLADHVEYLVVALLPEDAAVVDDDYQYVSNI